MSNENTAEMQRRLEDWVSRIADNPLPVLRSSHAFARYLQEEPETGVADLSASMSRDPALCINVLAVANAQRHRHLDNRTTTVEQAIMMLGIQRVLTLIQRYPVVEETLTGAARNGYMACMNQACHIALQATHWAEKRQDSLPAEINTAALVRSVGELAMWVSAPALLDHIRDLGGVRLSMRHEAEYVMLGFTLDDLSASLVQTWRLPPLVLELLVPNRITGMRTLGLTLATNLSMLAALGTRHPDVQKLITAVAAYLGLDVVEALDEIKLITDQAQSQCHTGSLPGWAALLNAAGEGTATVHEPLVCAIPRPALAQRLTALCMDGDHSRSLQQLRLRHEVVESIDPAVALALGALHRGYALSRVIYLRVNRDQDCCTPHLALGCQGAPDLPLLRLPALPPSELGPYLQSDQPHWLRGSSLASLTQSMLPTAQMLVEVSDCFMAAVHCQERIIGLLYADSFQSGRVLDQEAYKGFCQVAQALSSSLSKPAPAVTSATRPEQPS